MISPDGFGQTLLQQAHDAAARGEWQRSYELFLEADAASPLTGGDLPVLARVAYSAGSLDVTITAWERAYLEGMRQEDAMAAAAAAVQIAMHLLLDTALIAPVRAWLRRANQLLRDDEETPVHAWFAVVQNYERMLSGDTHSAREWARRAIDIGGRTDPAAAAIGRVAEARSLILDGKVEEGLPLLEAAGIAVLAGEIEPIAAGVVFCEMVCSLQGLAQYDLAEQWTEAMERWHQGLPVGSVHGRCRVHRAEILRLRGDYKAAESEALLACEELRPYLRRELGWPLTELGRIRLRMGEIEAAEDAFLQASALGWDAQPGLARVHLAQSRPDLASRSLRNALEHPALVPSKELPPNSDLRRAPLLEAQVEAELSTGDVEQADLAAAELSRIAAKFGSQALLASAASATGRVLLAQGDLAAARREMELAVRLWTDVGEPYEAAICRTWLANVYRRLGLEDMAVETLQSARLMFDQLGAKLDAARAGELVPQPAGDMPHPTRDHERAAKELHDRPGGSIFRREGDYWLVQFNGETTRLHDRRGMRYLARLLAEPGTQFHVMDLASAGIKSSPTAVAVRFEPELTISRGIDAGVLLDTQAKESYRRRLAEIEEDIDEAQEMGDIERAVQARAERDFLVHELARAVGLGGRDRKAGVVSERARVSVTRAIRQAMARIHNQHASLGDHLERAIRTGTYCGYLPDTRFEGTWTT